jgi:high-affinity nickel-transport protein
VRYRRAVGWIVVVLSYGMAALALGQMAGFSLEMDDTLFSGIGVGAAMLVILLAGGARWSARTRTASPSEGG